MPKEITHWYLAGLLREKLTPDSLFYEPVSSHENLFFLGAVTPDIPFFDVLAPGTRQVQFLAKPFHTSDSQALIPVLNFLNRFSNSGLSQGPDPAALALGAGVVSHILADTVFHPLVFYFCGLDGVHAGATARHRQFETAMDLHFLYLAGRTARTSLQQTIRGIEIPKHHHHGLTAALFKAETNWQKKGLARALTSFAAFQLLFRSLTIYRLMSLLEKKRMVTDTDVAPVYPGFRPRFLPFFGRPMGFRDPITGQAFRPRLRTMAHQAADAALGVLDMAGRSLRDGADPTLLMGRPDLPDVRPDIDVCPFWHGKEQILTALYQGASP